MLMRNPFRFFVELIQQPVWIPVWVLILMIVNVASVGFWNESLAKLIFLAFMLSAMLMMGLYSRFGFEKILGMGHILWLPLLIYVLMEIPAASGTFKDYLIIWKKISQINGLADNGIYALGRTGNYIWAGVYSFDKKENIEQGLGLFLINRNTLRVKEIDLDQLNNSSSC